MPNHLSILGIFHTIVSVLAIFAALFALFKYGKINPAKGGKLYIWLTVITCITGLPIMKTGHPTPGHFLAIIILAVLPIAIYAPKIKLFGKASGYVQIFIMSFTLLLSMIPLTRLPISGPIAADPGADIIKLFLGVWVLIFVVGLARQLFKYRLSQKAGSTPDAGINLS